MLFVPCGHRAELCDSFWPIKLEAKHHFLTVYASVFTPLILLSWEQHVSTQGYQDPHLTRSMS